MVIFLHILLYSITALSIKAVTKIPHITDFFNTPPKHQVRTISGPINESHAYLNNKLKYKHTSSGTHEEHIYSEIELGHTGRKDFVPLMQQREQHEETVNNALIAGILTSKHDPQKGQPLIKYAREHRNKSQQIQKKMNEIKSAGHIDPDVALQDNLKLLGSQLKRNREYHEAKEREAEATGRYSYRKRRKY